MDPEGGVELIRWMLRTDLPSGVFRPAEEIRFATRADFRAWFDEFRKKAEVTRIGGS